MKNAQQNIRGCGGCGVRLGNVKTTNNNIGAPRRRSAIMNKDER